jgi:hypothetical protein
MSRLARLVIVGSAVASAAPSGRVIRVDRTGGPASAPPRVCQVRADGGTCIGEEPHPGQTVLVLDEHRVVAEVQVIEAKPTLTSCENLWTIKLRAVRGALADGDKIGVIDDAVNPTRARVLDKAHQVSPSGQPGDEVWHALDRDGDGTADLVITRYGCDTSGRPVPGATTYCLDIWARGTGTHDTGKLVRTTQLNFATCNI